MVVVDVRDSGGNFSSGNSSSVLEDVLSDFGVEASWSFVSEEAVVKGISSSDDLDVIEIVGPDGWETDTAVVHLSGENLISEEIVSEKTGIGVCKVV